MAKCKALTGSAVKGLIIAFVNTGVLLDLGPGTIISIGAPPRFWFGKWKNYHRTQGSLCYIDAASIPCHFLFVKI